LSTRPKPRVFIDAHHVEGGEHVGLEGTAPGVAIDLLEASRGRSARVGDDDRGFADPAHRVDQPAALGGVADVARDEGTAQRRGDRFAVRDVAAVDHHLHALAGQRTRAGEAEPAGAAHHEGDLVLDAELQDTSPRDPPGDRTGHRGVPIVRPCGAPIENGLRIS
jgi:hypothetical protein